jgi:hypothetical protein
VSGDGDEQEKWSWQQSRETYGGPGETGTYSTYGAGTGGGMSMTGAGTTTQPDAMIKIIRAIDPRDHGRHELALPVLAGLPAASLQHHCQSEELA